VSSVVSVAENELALPVIGRRLKDFLPTTNHQSPTTNMQVCHK